MEKKLKYYYNEEKERLLIDENEYTPYLADRGYKEVTKEFYDTKSEELEEKYEEIRKKRFEVRLEDNNNAVEENE